MPDYPSGERLATGLPDGFSIQVTLAFGLHEETRKLFGRIQVVFSNLAPT